MHGGSEAGNGKATDDTDYSNVPGGPMPHTTGYRSGFQIRF
jgi:hypothetical protein